MLEEAVLDQHFQREGQEQF